MSKFLEQLSTGPVLADGAMGSYLFRRTGRLSERNHVYEALNLENPDLIRDIHLAYLRSGAQCLTTNSFGANRAALAANGEEGRCAAINRASVHLARETIESYTGTQGSHEPYFILASLGPVGGRLSTPESLEADYLEQIESLAAEKPDAFILETFSSIDEVLALAELLQRHSAIPVIAELALHRRSDSAWNQDPAVFLERALQGGLSVAGINCCAPWDALAFLDEIEARVKELNGRIHLSVMPNAGGFQRIGNRFMTRVNPEFMGSLTRTLAKRGVRLIGGCCEVHPRHLREMHNFLHGFLAGERAPAHVENARVTRFSPVGPETKRLNGSFSEKLFGGRYVVSVEIVPPRGTSPQVLNHRVSVVEALAESGLVDAIDITDGSRGVPLMPAADLVEAVRDRLGWEARTGDRIEFIPHFTCRDLNIMGLQSRLIGFHFRRIHNILCITGDPPKMSPTYPRSTAVFDTNSVEVIRYAHHHLNAGLDFGGESLAKSGDPRTHFTIGSGYEPESLDPERELEKLRRKIDAGADYVMTQPVFRVSALDALEAFRHRIHILAGVLVLTGIDHARRIAEVPGVVIPESVFRRFESFRTPEDQLKSGIELAVEQARWIRAEGWSGLYLMSPASTGPILEVLKGALT